MTFVTRDATLADIGRRSSFFLRSRAQLTYELQSRGMNSRLREEISSSSRHNSHPTNIIKLYQKGRQREQERERREREIPFPYTLHLPYFIIVILSGERKLMPFTGIWSNKMCYFAVSIPEISHVFCF